MKFKIVLLLIISLFVLIIPQAALAQTTSTLNTNKVDQDYLNTDPDVPNDLNTRTQATLISLLTGISCFLTGQNPITPQLKCLGVNPTTNKIGYVEGQGGVVAIAGNMIGATFEIPVSSTQYAKNVADNFGFTDKAFAQQKERAGGSGFNGLLPVLSLWQTFRNMTYLIFVILFIVIGLGIMFRVKIDPRTVMTVQNQIPKIIITLVLVTFSYAIAGFIIDLMYVSMYVIFNIFAPLINDTENLNPAKLQGANPITAVGAMGGFHIVKQVSAGAGSIIAGLFDGTIGNIIAGAIGAIIGGAATGFNPIGAVVGGLVGGVVLGSKLYSIIGSIIVFIVVSIAILSALFRLWFLLIKSYVYILIAVVFAPFQIALGLIPGRSGFGGWMRSLLSNIVVFPIVLTMILLGKIFTTSFESVTNGFAPPFVGDISPTGVGALIGLGIILMLPEVANMAKDTLKSPDLKYTTAIGKGVNVGIAAGSAIPRGIAGEFFGTTRTGMPKHGTRWVSQRFGTIIGGFLGGHGADYRNIPAGEQPPGLLPRPIHSLINRVRPNRRANPAGNAQNNQNANQQANAQQNQQGNQQAHQNANQQANAHAQNPQEPHENPENHEGEEGHEGNGPIPHGTPPQQPPEGGAGGAAANAEAENHNEGEGAPARSGAHQGAAQEGEGHAENQNPDGTPAADVERAHAGRHVATFEELYTRAREMAERNRNITTRELQDGLSISYEVASNIRTRLRDEGIITA